MHWRGESYLEKAFYCVVHFAYVFLGILLIVQCQMVYTCCEVCVLQIYIHDNYIIFFHMWQLWNYYSIRQLSFT